MSRAAEISLPFAGAERLFRLRIRGLRAVQEKCDAGPGELLARYVQGTWRLDDVREVILQGLVDGGMEQMRATRLLAGNFDDLPLAQFVPLAQAIVQVALVGAPEEDDPPPGEPEAGADPASPSRAEN